MDSSSVTQGVPSGPSDPSTQDWKDKSCSQLLGGGIKNLFGGKTYGTLKDQTTVSTLGQNSVPTFDQNTYNLIYQVNQKTADIQTNTTATNKKLNCWDSIAKIMMKIVIRHVTLSIIDWINHGYEGKPFFLSNPAGFFKDIAKNEFHIFAGEIGNPLLYPFGKNFLTGAILAFQNKFAANAQYSLNELIAKTNPGMTGASFTANFNAGGWNAWLGMTYPQNNPVGFGIMASNELAFRLDGTQTSTANQQKQYLQQSGGFLGDERCVDPHGVTHEDDAKARAGDKNYSVCNQWEYVTPGKLIAERITYAQNSPLQSLQMADDINSALAAIADAALNQFITNYSNKGLKALTDVGNTESVNISSGASNTGSGTQFPDFFVAPGTWLSKNLNFDMKTDVTQAFVDTQRIYLTKLASYSGALDDLIKNIRQLDYCIPGPNPDWELQVQKNIDAVDTDLASNPHWYEKGAWPTVHQYLDPAGIFDLIKIFTAKSDLKKAFDAASSLITSMLDVNVYQSSDGQVSDLGGVKSLLNNVFESYKTTINNIYFTGSPSYMPGVTPEARAEFANIAGYQKIIDNNNNETIFRKSIITRLDALKQKIDDLNSQLAAGTITGDQYENEFTSNAPLVTEFARLSAYFVDGDDIANIDNLYKESVDKKNYVHDDLLTGPFGCEADLHKLDKKTYDKYVGRQPYPLPILYYYNPFGGQNFWNDGPWSQSLFNSYNANPNLGFLYGALYRNNFVGSPPNNCPDQFLGYVFLGLPNRNHDDNSFQDIGGLDPNKNPANNCGVVTRGFEKFFDVY